MEQVDHVREQAREEALAFVASQAESLTQQHSEQLHAERQRFEALASEHASQLQQQAEAQANHDRLTLQGLSNQAHHEVAMRDQHIHLLQLELERLKQANDLAKAQMPGIPWTPTSVLTQRVDRTERHGSTTPGLSDVEPINLFGNTGSPFATPPPSERHSVVMSKPQSFGPKPKLPIYSSFRGSSWFGDTMYYPCSCEPNLSHYAARYTTNGATTTMW